MKILAINGSPKGSKSNSDKLLLPFLKGMENKGAETEVVYLNQYDIKLCTGCVSCWLRTPGKCVLKDDMQEIVGKVQQADVLVFATPLYFFGMTSLMKAFMDRLMPLVNPIFTYKNCKSSHDTRNGKKWKMVLITNGAFAEKEHYQALTDSFNKIAELMSESEKLDAVIVRPAGESFRSPVYINMAELVFKALERAGEEFIVDGVISSEALNVIEGNYLDVTYEEFFEQTNKYFEVMIKRAGRKRGE